jgi:hypothetical protein
VQDLRFRANDLLADAKLTARWLRTTGMATRTAVQAERELSSQMARNIRLPASTLEDRGHA